MCTYTEQHIPDTETHSKHESHAEHCHTEYEHMPRMSKVYIHSEPNIC
jgi:hypothetical protein